MRIFALVVIIALSEYNFRARSENLNDGLHLGDSWRLENVLRKALRGETLQLAIIGGSNSAGGGIEKNESTLDGLYYNVFSNWWSQNIGRKTGATLRRYNLAISSMGSYFFAFCYKTFLPQPEQVLDIVLVEQSVNFNTIGKAEPLEQLTRQLLLHPSNPAIIFIEFFSGKGKDFSAGKVINYRCSNLEDHGQTEVERHYRITSISLRDIICPVSDSGKRRLKQTGMFSSDGRHVGTKGHALVAQTLISYVWNTFNDVTVGRAGVSRQIPIVPRPIFVKIPLVVPLCWTFVTPDKFQDNFHPTLAVDVQSVSGYWLKLDEISGYSLRTDAHGGWAAKDAGSSVVFRVLVPPHSQLRSVIVLVRIPGNGGESDVWLDDNTDVKIKINNKTKFGQNQLFTVLSRVTPGYHYVTVKLVSRGNFMVIGLLLGPPDLDIKGVM